MVRGVHQAFTAFSGAAAVHMLDFHVRLPHGAPYWAHLVFLPRL